MATNRIRFSTDFVLDNNKIGIGTSIPDALLTVNGIGAFGAGAVTTPSIAQTGDLNTGFWFPAADTIAASTGGSERLRITAAGLLVGTSTSTAYYGATAKIYITDQGGTYLPLALETFRDDEAGAYLVLGHSRSGTAGNYTILQSNDGLGLISFNGSDGTDLESVGATIKAEVDGTPGANDMPGRLVFSTTADGAASPTERMRIANGGNFMVGTTTGSVTDGGLFYFSPAATSEPRLLLGHATGTGSGAPYVDFLFNAASIGSITQSGTTAVAYNTTSDYRLKENVTAFTDGIARLHQLKPCRFNFIAESERLVDGFLAHEVQTIVPEAITGEKDEVDADGNPVYQGIDQSKLVPLLTAALQEAVAKIESLEARLTAAGI
jgi:hypothetical protein